MSTCTSAQVNFISMMNECIPKWQTAQNKNCKSYLINVLMIFKSRCQESHGLAYFWMN